MLPFHQRLSSKIVAILIVFFVVALTAIGSTLLMSWQLEGSAAAINDAGSLRMHSYRIAYLLSEHVQRGDQGLRRELDDGVHRFDEVLSNLERGDPSRPLALPRQPAIQAVLAKLAVRWREHLKPWIGAILSAEGANRPLLVARYRADVDTFVEDINKLVLLVERSNAERTALLRTFQLGLVALALAGTVVLIYFFLLMVIRPVRRLQEGIRRMAAEDFSVRLPARSRDEFGQLAVGFNRMADHLQDLYGTLEERVRAKTLSLEEKNRELAILYEITAFLNEPGPIEELTREVLRRVMQTLGAQAGTVRLIDAESKRLHLIVQEGLPADFTKNEASLCMGECVCGEVASGSGARVAEVLDTPCFHPCRRAGFRAVGVFTIRFRKQVRGIVSLHFAQPRAVAPQEVHLLETLGQHLGVALENQRLVSRDKELAVSEERNLLAQELHDSIAQSLAFLNIQAQLLQDSLAHGRIGEAQESVAHIREGIQESYDDVRELLVHFRTRVHQADLTGAIRGALQKFEGQTGIRTRFVQTGSGLPLPPEFEVQVLHIVQEALSNVRKHAHARSVTVSVEQCAEDFTITVRDDGVGIDGSQATHPAIDTHVGIKIMKERAHRIGGELAIGKAGSGGTEVMLTLPIMKTEAA